MVKTFPQIWVASIMVLVKITIAVTTVTILFAGAENVKANHLLIQSSLFHFLNIEQKMGNLAIKV